MDTKYIMIDGVFSGWTVERGQYIGGREDRYDRWYCKNNFFKPTDDGHPTKQAAFDHFLKEHKS